MSVLLQYFIKEKRKLISLILVLISCNGIAQCVELWSKIDSIDYNKASALFINRTNDPIEGIWEIHNGVVFMIIKAVDNPNEEYYQMVMIKDRVYYGDWHIKVDAGSIIGLLKPTADKNIYSCKFKRQSNDATMQFHLSLKGSKLVYTGSSSIKRKLFAVKLSPKEDSSEFKKQSVSSPISKANIDREK